VSDELRPPPLPRSSGELPPEVRVISARGQVALSLMASLTEIAIVAATWWEHAHGRYPTELWTAVVLVPAIGPLVGKARGKIPGPTIAVLGSAIAAVLQRLKGA